MNTEQQRKVSKVIKPDNVSDGAGVRIKRSIGTQTINYLDPFLLFDQFGSDNPDDYSSGFPTHPHRGMETVTYMLSGVVQHSDSMGNKGVIGPGDVQWMTAGSGIMHDEMPQTREGRMEGFQLWVNLPAASKMISPRYQDYPAGQIPEVTRPDGTRIRIIAGTVDGVSGPVTGIEARPTYLEVRLAANASFTQQVSREQTAFAYIFEGGGSFGPGESGANSYSSSPSLVTFAEGDYVTITAGSEGARFLLVSGKPLNEPIARYGPFVMNTREEIEEALLDLRRGTFVK